MLLQKILKRMKNLFSQLLVYISRVLLKFAYRIRTHKYQAYQPLPWIGLSSKKREKASLQRWRWMESFLDDYQNKSDITSLRDFGSNLGYFVFRANEIGLLALGYELEQESIEVSQFVQNNLKAENVGFVKFCINSTSIKTAFRSDVTIFFSVWHHIIVHKGIDEARKVLQEIWATTDHILFFESGEDSEIAALGIQGDSADWVEAELRIACANSEIRRIGLTDRGDHKKGGNHRTLFAVTKPRGSS